MTPVEVRLGPAPSGAGLSLQFEFLFYPIYQWLLQFTGRVPWQDGLFAVAVEFQVFCPIPDFYPLRQ